MTTASLYERIGGSAAVDAAVNLLYEKVLEDNRINHFFEGVDIASLRDKQNLPELSPAESAVINYGREFFRTRRVSQTTFDAARAEFGDRGLIELTNLMGYYSVLAFNINAFEQLPPSSDEPFLPV